MSSQKAASHNRQTCTGSSTVLFPLGTVVATPGALEVLDRTGTNAAIILDRHQRGDFGAVNTEDAQANRAAIKGGTRILSSYTAGDARMWVITEADRSSTTLLLPEEY